MRLILYTWKVGMPSEKDAAEHYFAESGASRQRCETILTMPRPRSAE